MHNYPETGPLETVRCGGDKAAREEKKNIHPQIRTLRAELDGRALDDISSARGGGGPSLKIPCYVSNGPFLFAPPANRDWHRIRDRSPDTSHIS